MEKIQFIGLCLQVSFHLNADEYVLWSMYQSVFIFVLFSTPIFWRGMPTDCRLCCRGGNATRIEPSSDTKLWLWESSIWLRYFQPLHFMFHWISLEKHHFSFQLVIDMAVSVYVQCLGSPVLLYPSFRWFMLITRTAVWDYGPSGAGFTCTFWKVHSAMLCGNNRLQADMMPLVDVYLM